MFVCGFTFLVFLQLLLSFVKPIFFPVKFLTRQVIPWMICRDRLLFFCSFIVQSVKVPWRSWGIFKEFIFPGAIRDSFLDTFGMQLAQSRSYWSVIDELLFHPPSGERGQLLCRPLIFSLMEDLA